MLLALIQSYDFFTEDPSTHNYSSEVPGGRRVNVNHANFEGEAIITSMVRENVRQYIFKRSNCSIVLRSQNFRFAISKKNALVAARWFTDF